jgi:hypothetical protein
MDFTNKELNDAEEAIIGLSNALGCSEKEVIDILEDGFFYKYAVIPVKAELLIDELRAIFDAY